MDDGTKPDPKVIAGMLAMAAKLNEDTRAVPDWVIVEGRMYHRGRLYTGDFDGFRWVDGKMAEEIES